MTIDVEDYFQVSAMEPYVDRAAWDQVTPRVENNTHRILDMLAEHETRATFFTLGWVAERFPALLRRMVAEGHEVASHGWSHVRVINQQPDEFRDDVTRTKALLEDVTGQRVRGYRAASYSIGRDNLWALDVLDETGHDYSSSIFPIHHDLYGMPEAPRFPFHPEGLSLLEIPVTTVMIGERKLPFSGGGWFRLLPYGAFRWALKRVNRDDGQSAVFYFHPWEIDPDQPRQKGISAKTRFRHYLNLGRTEARLHRLLDEFSWGRMDEIFLGAEPGK
ncbi:MAG: DUF3473 domain-containing protein [Gammaproteobacteria bacterium]|nr:DUF3473 domain-containing protein [Gammaproteobacteria bacterium]MCP5137615.1 DUF3473 domain-containing protein [Gammaproteobacteria bacterium]